MKYTESKIKEVWIIEPEVFEDTRGYFFEAWEQVDFQKQIGQVDFIQGNELKSSFGVLRRLHYQKGEYSQAKLIRVIKGRVLDVTADLRKSSPTFSQCVSVELGEDNKRQLLIPRGFAHGFLVLSGEAIFTYKVDNPYAPAQEAGIRWDDETINISWPINKDKIVTSEKDLRACSLADVKLFDWFCIRILTQKRPYAAMKTSISTTVILVTLMFFVAGCANKSKQDENALSQEDMKAKQLPQDIWLSEDGEDIVFEVQKDTIYHPNSTSIPVYFKIVQDSLILQSSSAVKYSITRQTECLLEFKNQYGDVTRLVKSDNPGNEFSFVRKQPMALNQNSLIRRDTVINVGKQRYHLYVQANPTTYKIIKNSYADGGVEVGNVYYDNIVYISAYNGANKLFSRDFKKTDFQKFIPQQFYTQCILSDIVLDHHSPQSVNFKAYLPIPDSTTSYVIKIYITFEGKYELSI